VLLTAPVSKRETDQQKKVFISSAINRYECPTLNSHADPNTLMNVERLLMIHMIEMLVRVGAKTDGKNFFEREASHDYSQIY
jgi:hypothetical protein